MSLVGSAGGGCAITKSSTDTARETSQKARDSTTEGRASPSSSLGMTAREAAEQYCSHWIWAGYYGAWPRRNAPDLSVTKDEREGAWRAVSEQLKKMLLLAFERGEEEEPSAPNPTKSQEVKPIRRGRLPKKKDETGQVPIIAGLLNGEFSRLRVDAQGAWTLEPREDAFAGNPVGGKAKNETERFIVTRDDGATCRLTIKLKITEKRMRTKGGPIKPTKRAVYVSEKPSSWTHKRNPSQRREKLDNRARAMAFIRTVDEVERLAGPAPVPLRAQGQLGINQPLAPLAFDDIRNIEFDIEANEAFGDGRKFVGLRFFDAPAAEVDGALRVGAVPTEHHVAPEQEQVEGPGPGRKPSYNWDEFMYEMVRRALVDGLPDTLAEAEKMMVEWCINQWGERPVDSTIRIKLSPLYG